MRKQAPTTTADRWQIWLQAALDRGQQIEQLQLASAPSAAAPDPDELPRKRSRRPIVPRWYDQRRIEPALEKRLPLATVQPTASRERKAAKKNHE